MINHKFIEVIDFGLRSKIQINIDTISIIRKCDAGCEVVSAHIKYILADSYESVCNKIDLAYAEYSNTACKYN